MEHSFHFASRVLPLLSPPLIDRQTKTCFDLQLPHVQLLSGPASTLERKRIAVSIVGQLLHTAPLLDNSAVAAAVRPGVITSPAEALPPPPAYPSLPVPTPIKPILLENLPPYSGDTVDCALATAAPPPITCPQWHRSGAPPLGLWPPRVSWPSQPGRPCRALLLPSLATILFTRSLGLPRTMASRCMLGKPHETLPSAVIIGSRMGFGVFGELISMLLSLCSHIEVNPQHNGNLFFWHVQNKHIANRQRTVIWLNGGPGCSSEDGVMMEIGPYRAKDSSTLQPNNGSWHEFANLLFVDNPVGTGYSYVDTDSFVHELDEMADQFVTFLEKWFTLFPEYEHDDVSPPNLSMRRVM